MGQVENHFFSEAISITPQVLQLSVQQQTPAQFTFDWELTESGSSLNLQPEILWITLIWK